MRSKLLTLSLAVVVMVALATGFSVMAGAAQDNANKPAPMKGKVRKHKKPANHMHAMGIPTGTENCLNRLATLAAKEPLPAYEGEPMKIINEGMLWNDPKAKCAVSDQAQREKLADIANKWRMKDSAGVRSALQEMGGNATATAAPAEEKPMKMHKRRPAKSKMKAANSNTGM